MVAIGVLVVALVGVVLTLGFLMQLSTLVKWGGY